MNGSTVRNLILLNQVQRRVVCNLEVVKIVRHVGELVIIVCETIFKGWHNFSIKM